MNRKSSLWMGTAFPLVLACIGLTDCGGNASPTFPPTAIAVKRYLAGGGLDASFSGGAVATKIDPSEFEETVPQYGQTQFRCREVVSVLELLEDSLERPRR